MLMMVVWCGSNANYDNNDDYYCCTEVVQMVACSGDDQLYWREDRW